MSQSELSFPLFCALSVTSLLLLTCVTCHAGNLSSFSHSLSTASFRIQNFRCLEFRNGLLHKIVVSQRIKPFSAMKIIMISGPSRPNARPRGLVGYNDTSAPCPPRVASFAMGLSMLRGNKARRSGFQWHFQLFTRVFHGVLTSMSSGPM